MIADHPIARELFGTFQYLNPGTIHWGEGCVARLEGELSQVGSKRFLTTTASIALSILR
jgi:alcohol dehydrogenase YqhD (iron-dependent ADH family)